MAKIQIVFVDYEGDKPADVIKEVMEGLLGKAATAYEIRPMQAAKFVGATGMKLKARKTRDAQKGLGL